MPLETSRPSPKRIAAGRLNRQKRGALTPEVRDRLRQAALANKPWLMSTGPRTAEGKNKVAANGKYRQVDQLSVRQARREVAGLLSLTADLEQLRSMIAEGTDSTA